MKRFIAPLFLSLLLAAACTSRLEGEVEIHSTGFGFETYLPITPENIVERHDRYGKVDADDPRMQEVLTLIKGAADGDFYDGATRARLRDSHGTTIYIDEYGGIGRPGRDAALDEAGLSRLAELLWSMTTTRNARNLPTWAEEAANAHVAQTRGWQRTDYTITSESFASDGAEAPVIVRVTKVPYEILISPTFSAYRRVMAARDDAFELHFDPKTKKLIREAAF